MRMTGNPLMVALLISAASLAAATAVAEPLDKVACAKLQIERKVLLTPEMQAALDRGPDWVKKNLDEAKMRYAWEVLYFGVLNVTRAFLPLLRLSTEMFDIKQ